MTNQWQIAQMNVGTIRYDHDDPRMHGFMSRLDEINALADSSPGFVWRLQSESGNATDVDVGREPLFLVNMSVWENIEFLFDYVYKTAHTKVMKDRKLWFEKPTTNYQVLWWVPAGHIPTTTEGLDRLDRLEQLGPSPEAFNIKSKIPAPGSQHAPDQLAPEPYCAGWD